MKKRFSLFLACFSIVVCAVLSLTSCQDLGDDVKTEEDYYELYPYIYMFDSDGSATYDMDELYTEDIINNPTSPIAKSEYTFMVIVVKSDKGVSFDSVAMIVLYDEPEGAMLDAKAYYTDDAEVLAIIESTKVLPPTLTQIGSVKRNIKPRLNEKKNNNDNSFEMRLTKTTVKGTGYIIIAFNQQQGGITFSPTAIMVHTKEVYSGEED